MQTRTTNKFILFWLFVMMPILLAIIFRKSFNLGLYGDDWQHLYILWKDFFVYHTKSFFDIKSYLNPYYPESLYLGVIQHFWGYYPPAYFISSYICRLFANISLYFFSYELTKSKLASFLTTLIFLVSAAGLQTTDWVFNMNTYIGLGFLAISATLYMKIRQIKTFKSWYYIFFIITFILALAIVPTRMHGVVPFIILTEFFITTTLDKQIKLDKYLITRVFLVFGLFFLLVHFRSFGAESFVGGRLSDSSAAIKTLIKNGYYSWWLYFIGIIGHLVLPDNDFVSANAALSNFLITQVFFSILLLSISSFSFLRSRKVIVYLPILMFNLGLFIFLTFMNRMDMHTSGNTYFSIFLGGQFLFWAIWFYIISRNKYSSISATLIISVFWIICLTIIYWLFTPDYVIETTGRYLTMGAAGISIFLGTLSTLLIKQAITSISKSNQSSRFLASLYLGVPILILSVFLLTNFQAGQNYLSLLEQVRNKDLTEKTWKTLLKEVPKLDTAGPSVFFFTTDNPNSLQGVLVFGFFMRAGIEYQNPVEAITPLPVTDYQQLLDIVKTGEPLEKVHGRKKAPVPLSRVYAFDFRGGELINITDKVHKKISLDLNL